MFLALFVGVAATAVGLAAAVCAIGVSAAISGVAYDTLTCIVDNLRRGKQGGQKLHCSGVVWRRSGRSQYLDSLICRYFRRWILFAVVVTQFVRISEGNLIRCNQLVLRTIV